MKSVALQPCSFLLSQLMHSFSEHQSYSSCTFSISHTTHTQYRQQPQNTLQGLAICSHLCPQGQQHNLPIDSEEADCIHTQARALRFLDVSENSIDKRTAEFLVQAITKQPLPSNSSFIDTCSPSDLSTLANILHPSAPLLHDLPPNATPDKSHLTSLRMENASLKPQTIEVLAHAIRHPDAKLRHVSLRRNKISPLGAVALAVMMRDYPETEDHPMPSTSIVTAKAQSEGNSINSPTLSSMIGRARPVLDSPITTSPTRTHSPTPLPRPVSPSVQERFGCLLTLDVRSNEIRVGHTFTSRWDLS